MAKKKIICYIFILSALGYNILIGQPADYSTKRETIHLQLERLSGLHDSIFPGSKELVNGKLYYSGGNAFVHPFFGDNSWSRAIIHSSGKADEMNLAKYDLYLDYLVILHNSESFSYPIYLNKESTREFTIYGHHFKYLEDFEGSVIDELVPGYYEELYKGETKFFIRRVKLKNFDNAELSEVYADRIYFFLQKGGKYFKVHRHKSLIKALNDRKKEINAFMKKNHLRFSPDNYEVIGKILTYYDTL
jgi:hypothetical protein